MRPPLLIRHFWNRPALLGGLLVALIVTALGLLHLSPARAVLAGYSFGAATYLGLALRIAANATVTSMQRRAIILDQGSGFIVAVTIAASVASVAAIVIDLAEAKSTGHGSGIAIAFAAGTLLLSWLFVHTVFAFHYAHIFYLDRKSIVFPGTDEPDYWDFLYFSAVIGMTAQVSDVTTAGPAIRRVVMAHSLIAFFFNTAVLALGVNMAAALAS